MEIYRDGNHDSGVRGFEIREGQIDVHFKTGAVYRYTTSSVGAANLRQMIALARAGDGLNAFINNFVKDRYAAKLR